MKTNTQRMARILLTAGLAVGMALLAGCGGSSSSSTSNPAISFTAPASGATVEVGTTLTVSLDVQNAGALQTGIFVIGQGDFGSVQMPAQAPYEATIAIPSNLALGNYTLTAIGSKGTTGSTSDQVTTTTVVKVVPNPTIPIKLQLPQGGLVFEAIGERLPITVPGATSGLEYTSAAPNIATVAGPGIVTAQQTGSTSITVSQNGSFIGSVPIQVLAPALLPSPANIDFGDQASGTTSAAQTITITNNTAYAVSVLAVNSGTVFPDTDGCVSASPLAPGASCSISVSFSPTATGSVSGALDITDSAVIASTRILLTGNGT